MASKHPTPMLTAAEVARQLATTEDHVRRLAQKGALPCVRLGDGPRARVRFSRSAIEKLVRGLPAD
jgi:excisionase family DNA binding protein